MNLEERHTLPKTTLYIFFYFSFLAPVPSYSTSSSSLTHQLVSKPILLSPAYSYTYIYMAIQTFSVWSQIQLPEAIFFWKKRMVGNGARISIPAGAMKTVETIKEITADNYSEYEIHAMLLKWNMNPMTLLNAFVFRVYHLIILFSYMIPDLVSLTESMISLWVFYLWGFLT